MNIAGTEWQGEKKYISNFLLHQEIAHEQQVLLLAANVLMYEGIISAYNASSCTKSLCISSDN
jgi:hypothetical protein